MMEYHVGKHYDVDDLPDNEMNNSGNLEWVADDTLALVDEHGRIIEFEFSHVRCTAVRYVTDEGYVVDEKPEGFEDD